MGTIVCKSCESTIGHFEDEKVTVLYAASHKCNKCDTPEEEK